MIEKKNISLYFNARLIGKQLVKPNRNSFYVSPIMYPTSINQKNLNQYEVLVNTIITYSKINFNVAIFNLDIGNYNDGDTKDIKKLLIKYIRAKKLIINFTRPSNSKEWYKSVTNAHLLIGYNQPTLIVMNHDHFFLDDDDLYLDKIVNDIFNTNNDFGKMLAYSHIPELISEILLQNNKTITKNYVYKNEKANNKPPIYITTMETLIKYLPSNVSDESLYIGRLMDWVYPRNIIFNVRIFIPLRELFKHYDGYGHITPTKLIRDLRLEDINRNNQDNEKRILLDYYEKWLSLYFIYLRDSIKYYNIMQSPKYRIRKAIDNTFDQFVENHLVFDNFKNKLPEKRIIDNSSALYSHIYFNMLFIYEQIHIENLLLRNSYINRIYMRCIFLKNKIF
jgi:hypothetical protein